MEGILSSFDPLFKKYKIEAFLIFSALVITFITIIIFILTYKTQSKQQPIKISNPPAGGSKKIFIDIAGSVQNPDVYETSSGARLKDVLILAGGLSAQADRRYFSKNYNMARLVTDQEKIYVPSTEEIESGEYKQTPSSQSDLSSSNKTNSAKININSASITELDSLSGVGMVTAQKIIQNRPYSSIDDLLNKKIVNKTVFGNIKDSIEP